MHTSYNKQKVDLRMHRNIAKVKERFSLKGNHVDSNKVVQEEGPKGLFDVQQS